MYFKFFAKSSSNSFPSGGWTPGSCPAWICPSSLKTPNYQYPASNDDAGGFFCDTDRISITKSPGEYPTILTPVNPPYGTAYSSGYCVLKGPTHNNSDFVFAEATTDSVQLGYAIVKASSNYPTLVFNSPSWCFRVRVKKGWKISSTSYSYTKVSTGGITASGTSFTNVASGSNYNEWEVIFKTNGTVPVGGSAHGYVNCNLNLTPETYTITYNYNGSGQSNTTASSTGGSAVTLPSPTRTGYSFDGWYTAASGGSLVGAGGASYTPSGNITLYARWSPIKYTIVFNGNGATSGSTSSIEATYGTSYTLTSNGFSNSNGKTVSFNGNGGNSPSAITSTSYFYNWNTKADGTGTSYNDMASVENLRSTAGTVTLYAQWKSNAISLPSSTRVGYTFNGWYTAASGGTKVGGSGGSYTPTANVTLYAQWTQQTYTITFNSNGGSTPNPSTKSVTYDSTYGTLPTVTRTGYTFAGWYTATSGGSKIESSTKVTVTSAQTLYAQWTANNYTVTFDANGGNTSTSSKSVVFNSAYGALPTPTRAQYNFMGWYTATSGGTKITETSIVSTAANHTLYAHWGIGKYFVKFDGNGATSGSMSNQEFTFGQSQKLSVNAFKRYNSTDGYYYDFLGWATSSTSGEVSYADEASVINLASTPDEVITLYAVWRKKVKITVESDNPTLGSVNNITGYYSIGAKLTLIATIKDSTEIRFLGWYLNGVKQSGSASYEITVGVSDLTYIAKFRSVVHYLTVIDPAIGGDITVTVGGEEIAVPDNESTRIKVLEGISVQLRAEAEYNYDSKGWTITDKGSQALEYADKEVSFVVGEENDVEIYARPKFEEKPKFKITVSKTGRGRGAGTIKITDSHGHTFTENQSGSIVELLYVGIQYQVQASVDSTAPHVRFNGWYANDSALGKNDVYTILQTEVKDVVLSADFKSSLHTLNISTTEPNYAHIEARIGNTLLDDITGVTVSDGQKISVKVIISTLCLLDEWTVDSAPLPDKKNEITVDIVESMGDIVDVKAHIDKRAQTTFTASKVHGEYGTISVSYDDIINTDNGTVEDNTVTYTEDANGIIQTQIYSGVIYKAVAVVYPNVSLAGRQLSIFEGWFAKINNEYKKQTSDLEWTFNDIADVEGRFKAYPLYSVSCAVVNGEGSLVINESHNTPDAEGNKFIEGQSVKVNATPSEGYELNYITVKNITTGESSTVKDIEVLLSNIKADFVIEASFSKKKCSVTYAVDEYSKKAGSISASVDGVNEPDFTELEYGDKVSFTAIVADGYIFDGWYINGKKESSEKVYKITLVESVNVIAKFKAQVILTKSSSFSASGTVYISDMPDGGWTADNGSSVSAWIILGEKCYIKAEAANGSFFGAWYKPNDSEYEEPLDLSNEDSFQVLDSTSLVARFVSEEDYIYIALFNEWVDITEKDDTIVLGDLSMTDGTEITEAEYNEGLKDKGYAGAQIKGARAYYRFTGSKKSTLSAHSTAGRVFDRWERRTLTNGEFGDPVVYSSEEIVSINTSRNIILTAFWGTPKPVKVVLNFYKNSEGLGTLRLDGNTIELIEDEMSVTALIMQGESISIAADAKNGYKFVGWFYDRDNDRLLSDNQKYTFEVKYGIEVFAKFEEDRNAIYKWEGSSVMKTLRWKSKVYVSTKPFDPGCARVDATGYGVKLRVDLYSSPDIQPKNNNFKDVTIMSQDCRRLPKSRPERYMQIGLQANKEIDSVFVGTSMMGITI